MNHQARQETPGSPLLAAVILSSSIAGVIFIYTVIVFASLPLGLLYWVFGTERRTLASGCRYKDSAHCPRKTGRLCRLCKQHPERIP